MLSKISGLLLGLHRDCPEPTIEEFPRWALDFVKPALPFDAGFWGSGCVVAGEIVAHDFWLYDLPREAMQVWERNKHLDTMGPLVAARRNRVINFTHAAMREKHAAYYEILFHPQAIEQALSIYADNEDTGLFDVLSLFRSDPAAPFSEEERHAFECLVPHLVEARRTNYLNHRSSGDEVPKAGRRHLAATDAKGILHAIEGGFTALMRIEWPGWQGPRLPLPVSARISERSGRFLGEAIAIDFEPVLDMTLLHARRRQPVDKLSERQVAIARAFAQGDSHKEVARSLDLSPATVRNHLSAIYDTLGIGSKAELATLLARHGR